MTAQGNSDQRWKGNVEAELRSIGRRLDQFERVCAGCSTRQDAQVGQLRESLDKALDRLRLIEIRLGFVAGGAALLGTIIGALVPWFLSLL